MTTALIITPSPDLLPAPLFAPTAMAAKRFVEFFTAQINNEHTRKAYLNATRRAECAVVGATCSEWRFCPCDARLLNRVLSRLSTLFAIDLYNMDQIEGIRAAEGSRIRHTVIWPPP